MQKNNNSSISLNPSIMPFKEWIVKSAWAYKAPAMLIPSLFMLQYTKSGRMSNNLLIGGMKLRGAGIERLGNRFLLGIPILNLGYILGNMKKEKEAIYMHDLAVLHYRKQRRQTGQSGCYAYLPFTM